MNRIVCQRCGNDPNTDNVYFPIGRGLHFFELSGAYRDNPRRFSFVRARCLNCDRTGHYSSHCDQIQQQKRCTYCTQSGHNAQECRLRLRANNLLYDLGYVREPIDATDRYALALSLLEGFVPVPPRDVPLSRRTDYRFWDSGANGEAVVSNESVMNNSDAGAVMNENAMDDSDAAAVTNENPMDNSDGAVGEIAENDGRENVIHPIEIDGDGIGAIGGVEVDDGAGPSGVVSIPLGIATEDESESSSPPASVTSDSSSYRIDSAHVLQLLDRIAASPAGSIGEDDAEANNEASRVEQVICNTFTPIVRMYEM